MRQAGLPQNGKTHRIGGLIGFGLLAIIGIGACGLALSYGKAPFNAGLQLSDWVKWVQIEGTASGLSAFFGILGLIGLTGFVKSLLPTGARVAPVRAETPPVAEPIMPDDFVEPDSFVAQAADIPPPQPTAEIIPFRQEPVAVEAAPEIPAHTEPTHTEIADPIAQALLAEAPDTEIQAPAADIDAVIHSAMRFIETPDPAPQSVTSIAEVHSLREIAEESDTPPPRPLSEALIDRIEPEHEAPVTPPAAGISENAQALIVAATQVALSQWPETTRPIAEAELSTRLAQLYYDPSPDCREVFETIGAGDLSGAAEKLKAQAGLVANTVPARAADLWRIYGALHMGREDDQAMYAYEQVSLLDPSDANIHLYLVRRYEMAGQSEALLPVIARALAVTDDASLQNDLLTRQAELAQAAEDWGTTASALEGLSVIRAREAEADPDNLQKRSAHAIAMAKLAQVRERLGDFPKAGPLYEHAHEVFAELSAKVPDHAGLRAMAENALRDARRFRA